MEDFLGVREPGVTGQARRGQKVSRRRFLRGPFVAGGCHVNLSTFVPNRFMPRFRDATMSAHGTHTGSAKVTLSRVRSRGHGGDSRALTFNLGYWFFARRSSGAAETVPRRIIILGLFLKMDFSIPEKRVNFEVKFGSTLMKCVETAIFKMTECMNNRKILNCKYSWSLFQFQKWFKSQCAFQITKVSSFIWSGK